MASFKFNFPDPTEPTDPLKRKAAGEDPNGSVGGSKMAAESSKNKVEWTRAKEHFFTSASLEMLAEEEAFKEYPISETLVLPLIDSAAVTDSLPPSTPLAAALASHSDLVPGVYEGGLKIWECSEDLVRYLALEEKPSGSTAVLEVGCGAGLPGLWCFRNGADVHFQDYNAEVIERITMPNVLLSAPDIPAGGPRGPDGPRDGPDGPETPMTRFFSGDWDSFASLYLQPNHYDLILSSETIYNVDNQEKLLRVFAKGLKANGRVLVAAKEIYFGVGGGLRQFERLAGVEWNVRTVKRFTDGVNREIVELTRK